jgi:hypothetical protein
MQVWEAHRDLSLTVGDSIGLEAITVPPTVLIPDGARFTSAHRNSALYRAMLTILMDAKKMLSGLPRNKYVEQMAMWFPNQVKRGVLTTPAALHWLPSANAAYGMNAYIMQYVDYPKPFSVLTLELINNVTAGSLGKRQPIPFKNDLVEGVGLSSYRSTQRPDPYATYHDYSTYAAFEVIDAYGELNRNSEVWLNYIPYPTYPDSVTNYLTDITVEDVFIPKMITLASIFMLSEAQDVESMSQFMPLTLGHITPLGGQNGNQ